MRLVDLIHEETGADYAEIMLLRHSTNKVEGLEKAGGSIDEYTNTQPIGSRYDYFADNQPHISVVVEIVRDHVSHVYRVLEIEAEGLVSSLVSEENRKFYQTEDYPDRMARRFRMKQLNTASVGMPITGWEGGARSPTARSNRKTFWKIEINLPTVVSITEEIISTEGLYEGSVCRVNVNVYERNARAREDCIRHYGTSCTICGCNFGALYGSIAEGFIHVHHLKPLSEIGEEYQINPIEDLRPVCPNCHAIIHLGGFTRSVEDVKELLNNSES